MAGKRGKPEEIVSKLRQVEVLQGQGMPVAQALRQCPCPLELGHYFGSNSRRIVWLGNGIRTKMY